VTTDDAWFVPFNEWLFVARARNIRNWDRPIVALPQRLSEMEGHPTRCKVTKPDPEEVILSG